MASRSVFMSTATGHATDAAARAWRQPAHRLAVQFGQDAVTLSLREDDPTASSAEMGPYARRVRLSFPTARRPLAE
jgi:hypothetical protein